MEEPALARDCCWLATHHLPGRCRCLVPVIFNVQLGRFFGMMRCVMRVSLCRVRVMSSYRVVAFFVMLGGFAMVNRRVLVVLRCLVMMRCCLF